MYIEKRKILFIHIPKTAGRAISSSFGIYSHPHLSFKECIDHYNIEDIKNIFNFAIIRDPHDRFVSSYRQLVGKPDKRVFSEFKRFSPEDFRKWVKTVWYPTTINEKITVDDPEMEKYIDSLGGDFKNSSTFCPDTYHFWLSEKDNKISENIELLDFRNLAKEIKRAESIYNKFFNLEANPYYHFDSSEIKKSNIGNYNDFWDSESIEIFNSFNKKDIKFYEKFLNNVS